MKPRQRHQAEPETRPDARTALLLAARTGFFLAAGYRLGGEGGMVIAVALALGMTLLASWNADRLVPRMSGAREVDRQSAPDLAHLDNQQANRNPATAHLFIVDPRRARGVNGLFIVNPPSAEQVRRRREKAGAPPPGAGPWG